MEFSRLNQKTIDSLYEDFKKFHGRNPKSLEEALNDAENDREFFNQVAVLNHEIGYSPERNVISANYIYSGVFKRQRLMTNFYGKLGEIIDFDDLECLEFSGTTESGTRDISDEIKHISNIDRLREILKEQYLKSPFMRFFKTMGYGDITISREREETEEELEEMRKRAAKSDISNIMKRWREENGRAPKKDKEEKKNEEKKKQDFVPTWHIDTLQGRKSDELKFHMKEIDYLGNEDD